MHPFNANQMQAFTDTNTQTHTKCTIIEAILPFSSINFSFQTFRKRERNRTLFIHFIKGVPEDIQVDHFVKFASLKSS